MPSLNCRVIVANAGKIIFFANIFKRAIRLDIIIMFCLHSMFQTGEYILVYYCLFAVFNFSKGIHCAPVKRINLFHLKLFCVLSVSVCNLHHRFIDVLLYVIFCLCLSSFLMALFYVKKFGHIFVSDKIVMYLDFVYFGSENLYIVLILKFYNLTFILSG